MPTPSGRVIQQDMHCPGDFFAAVGAGIMSGAGEAEGSPYHGYGCHDASWPEIAGFDELMKGDFAGAMEKRRGVWEAGCNAHRK